MVGGTAAVGRPRVDNLHAGEDGAEGGAVVGLGMRMPPIISVQKVRISLLELADAD